MNETLMPKMFVERKKKSGADNSDEKPWKRPDWDAVKAREQHPGGWLLGSIGAPPRQPGFRCRERARKESVPPSGCD
jgi:hypothetical protein